MNYKEFIEQTDLIQDYTQEDLRKTAAQYKIEQMVADAKAAEHMARVRAQMEEEEKRRAPQDAMDRFLGGVPYGHVLELVKEAYPERFI